jgi:hypothetical protein
MTIWEFMKAEDDVRKWRALPQEDKFLAKYLQRYIFARLTVQAHAWCMDVYDERKKMTNVILEMLQELKANGY